MTTLILVGVFVFVAGSMLFAAWRVDAASKRRAAVRHILRHTQPIYPAPVVEANDLAWFRPRGAA